MTCIACSLVGKNAITNWTAVPMSTPLMHLDIFKTTQQVHFKISTPTNAFSETSPSARPLPIVETRTALNIIHTWGCLYVSYIPWWCWVEGWELFSVYLVFATLSLCLGQFCSIKIKCLPVNNKQLLKLVLYMEWVKNDRIKNYVRNGCNAAIYIIGILISNHGIHGVNKI